MRARSLSGNREISSPIVGAVAAALPDLGIHGARADYIGQRRGDRVQPECTFDASTQDHLDSHGISTHADRGAEYGDHCKQRNQIDHPAEGAQIPLQRNPAVIQDPCAASQEQPGEYAGAVPDAGIETAIASSDYPESTGAKSAPDPNFERTKQKTSRT